MTDVTIRPFRIEVPQADVDDLQARLLHTRWPDEPADAGWDYGLPLGYAKELVDYWTTGYDWRAHEAALNAIPQFVTTVDGTDVHFLHVRSAPPNATPLLLVHGWPGSVLEFAGLVGPLTDPPVGSPPFDVVIPSIPGFGLSGPTRTAAGPYRGAHLTMLPSAVAHPGADTASIRDLTDADRAEIRASAERFAQMHRNELGYGVVQSTKPQTLAYGLTDRATRMDRREVRRMDRPRRRSDSRGRPGCLAHQRQPVLVHPHGRLLGTALSRALPTGPERGTVTVDRADRRRGIPTRHVPTGAAPRRTYRPHRALDSHGARRPLSRPGTTRGTRRRPARLLHRPADLARASRIGSRSKPRRCLFSVQTGFPASCIVDTWLTS
jgi:hypothetical protein